MGYEDETGVREKMEEDGDVRLIVRFWDKAGKLSNSRVKTATQHDDDEQKSRTTQQPTSLICQTTFSMSAGIKYSS